MSSNRPNRSYSGNPYYDNKPSKKQTTSKKTYSPYDSMVFGAAKSICKSFADALKGEPRQEENSRTEETPNPPIPKHNRSSEGYPSSGETPRDGNGSEISKRQRLEKTGDKHHYHDSSRSNVSVSQEQKNRPDGAKNRRKAVVSTKELEDLNSPDSTPSPEENPPPAPSGPTVTTRSTAELKKLKHELTDTLDELKAAKNENFALRAQLDKFERQLKESDTKSSKLERENHQMMEKYKQLEQKSQKDQSAGISIRKLWDSSQNNVKQLEEAIADKDAALKMYAEQRKKYIGHWQQQTSDLEKKLQASKSREADLSAAIQKYNLTIAYTHSRNTFHNEKDDAYFQQGLAALESDIQNWVFANFRGLKEIPEAVLDQTKGFTFSIPDGDLSMQDAKETALRLRNFVISYMMEYIFDGYHCGMTEELRTAFSLVSSFFADDHEKNKWKAKTLHQMFQNTSYQEQTKENINLLVTHLDNSLKPWAHKTSKDVTRIKKLTKILEKAAEISSESCLLSSSSIQLEWPTGYNYDDETMKPSNISAEDEIDSKGGQKPLGGFVFPQVLKHHYGDDGKCTTGVIRKATVYILPDVLAEIVAPQHIEESNPQNPPNSTEEIKADQVEPESKPSYMEEESNGTGGSSTPRVDTDHKEDDLICLNEVQNNFSVMVDSTPIGGGYGGGGVSLAAQYDFDNPPHRSANEVEMDGFIDIGDNAEIPNDYRRQTPSEHLYQSLYETAYEATPDRQQQPRDEHDGRESDQREVDYYSLALPPQTGRVAWYGC